MAHHHASRHVNQHAKPWVDRTAPAAPDSSPPPDDIERRMKSQAFHRPHTSYGAAHWIHIIGGILPLALSELIPDPAKYRKAMRIAAIGTTLAYEAIYTFREQKRHEEQEAKLAECRSRE